MSIAPKLPRELTMVPPPSADSMKEPQLIVKAVYVSLQTVITQRGTTNRMGEGGQLLLHRANNTR